MFKQYISHNNKLSKCFCTKQYFSQFVFIFSLNRRNQSISCFMLAKKMQPYKVFAWIEYSLKLETFQVKE